MGQDRPIMDIEGHFCHHTTMAGLGEARRKYHRESVAYTLRELRGQKGWSQEDLADRLGIDRRQVVRFESGRAPVTLEVVEALARVFGVLSMFFMTSALEDKGAQIPEEGGFVQRLAEKEYGNLIGSALARPAMAYLMHTAVALTDDHLNAVGDVANAFLQAQIVARADLEEYSFVLEAMFPSGRPERPSPRSRSTSVPRARKSTAEAGSTATETTPARRRIAAP
jgi:putative transcriptional regulator